MLKKHCKSDWFLACLVSLALLLASGSNALQSLERKAYDWAASAAHRDTGDKVAIIAIDDQIANIGRWSWSRDVQAQMLDKLSAAKSKVIGTTVLFLELQIYPGLAYINQIAIILKAQTNLNADAKLAASIKSANNVVLAMPFVMGEPLTNPHAPLPAYVTKNQLANVVNYIGDESALNPIPAKAAIAPIALIGEFSAAIGHLNTSPDSDGAIRVEPLVLRYYDQIYPSAALQIAVQYLNLSIADIKARLNNNGYAGVSLGKLNIATNSALQMRTFFYADSLYQLAFPVDSFFDVLSGKIPVQKYADKIVRIGATANGVTDSFVTPISANMKPIETLAHSVASILNEDFYISPSWAVWAESSAWLLVALYLVFLFPHLKSGNAVFITIGFLLTLVATHYVLMTQKGWWLQLMMPCVLLLIGHALLTTKCYLVTEKGKAKSDVDSTESNRNLALMFKSQGQKAKVS